jgi:hypothetical protein
MGGLSIWHWLVPVIAVLCIAGVVLWLTRRSARKYPGELKGIGGWLALLEVFVTLMPLGMLERLIALFRIIEAEAWRRFPLTIAAQVAVPRAFLLLSSMLAVLMYRRSSRFPAFFVQVALFQVFLNPLVFLLLVLLGYIETNQKPINLTITDVALQLLPSTIVSAIFCVVWTLYLKRSKRVTNTFVN